MKPTREEIRNWLILFTAKAGKDQEIADEILDILYDYDKQTQELQAMTRKFRHPDPIIRSGEFFRCPDCGQRVHPKHSHCHWCGKALKSPRGF